MTDLKHIITTIQSDKNNDRWYEIVKAAYERGELVKLLSADDDYVYDSDGNLWLHSGGPDADLDADPIDIRAVVSGIDKYYFKTESKKFKLKTIETFFELLRGTPQQVYFAVQMFCALASDDADESSAFYDFINKIPFTDALRPALTSTIHLRKEELSQCKIFNCAKKENGIYDHCIFYSELLEDEGIDGFVEE